MTQAFWSIDWTAKAREMDEYERQYVIQQINIVSEEKRIEKIKKKNII